MSDDDHIADVRGLIGALRNVTIPEGWDPASGGAYVRTLWAPDVETANDINARLDRPLELSVEDCDHGPGRVCDDCRGPATEPKDDGTPS